MSDSKAKGTSTHVPRGSAHYIVGREAYMAGETECPSNLVSMHRTSWWTGWLDARTVSRLGPFFENWNGKRALDFKAANAGGPRR